MIHYNFKYRSPYEYDKFVLNFFQLHNEVISVKVRNFPKGEVRDGAMKEEYAAMDSLFTQQILDDDQADKLYLQSLKLC